jgi:MFS family permease
MSSTVVISAEMASGAPQINPWLIGVVVSLAAFMEVLDTSIANVALPHIAGSMGASNDESTWVLTSYLVSNAIVLPISGFLVSLLGRKRFFLICITFFTVSSFLCGVAPSLGLLLLFRVLQGAFGGGLQPMTQAILADTRSSWFNEAVADLTTRLSHAGFDMYSAHEGAILRMYSMLNAQAQALSYIDVYWLLSLISVLMFFLCFSLAKNEPGGSGNFQMH